MKPIVEYSWKLDRNRHSKTSPKLTVYHYHLRLTCACGDWQGLYYVQPCAPVGVTSTHQNWIFLVLQQYFMHITMQDMMSIHYMCGYMHGKCKVNECSSSRSSATIMVIFASLYLSSTITCTSTLNINFYYCYANINWISVQQFNEIPVIVNKSTSSS